MDKTEDLNFVTNVVDDEVLQKLKSQKEEKEETWELDGETLTESDLLLLIKVSEAKGTSFNVGRFLLFFFYHIVWFCMTPFIGVPVIYCLEGFDFHLIRNMGFCNLNVTGVF